MKQALRKSLTICLAAVLCCAGCAKHEVLKQDQMIPAVAPASPALSSKSVVPVVAKTAPQETVLATTPISEERVAGQGAKNAAAGTGKEGALQAGLHKVYFDFNSPTLSPAAREILAKNAEILKQQASVKIRIEGNCDEFGSDDYNLSLGESRAKSAMHYLQSLGIKADRISVISYGKEKPADPGHDESARAKNRRDEFVISSN
jgi:peptidoglycan-associated lipoprotein